MGKNERQIDYNVKFPKKSKKRDRSRLRQVEMDLTVLQQANLPSRVNHLTTTIESIGELTDDGFNDLRGRIALLEQAIGEIMKNYRLQSEYLRSTRGTLGGHIARLERKLGIGEFDASDLAPTRNQLENLMPHEIQAYLEMVSIDYISQQHIAEWTEEQRAWASAWAIQQHLLASDNEFYDFELVAKPPHLDKEIYEGSPDVLPSDERGDIHEPDGPDFPDRLSDITDHPRFHADRPPGWR